MDLLTSPLSSAFRDFLHTVERRCVICSPYVGADPVRQLVAMTRARGLERSLDVTVLTDVSLDHLVAGSTDINALVALKDSIQNTSIYHLPSVHAKVYVSDEKLALIGSANFTTGGWLTNLEYAVRLDVPAAVRRVRHDIEQYARLGGAVSDSHLLHVRTLVNDLRLALNDERLSIDSRIREAAETLRQQASDELLRARIGNRTVHSIFSETIEYVLKDGPLPTEEIHQRVRGIHPDLCDDTIDRVIDGQRYGKLWKHQVRSAQQHLKRTGRIAYEEESHRWHRLPTRFTAGRT